MSQAPGVPDCHGCRIAKSHWRSRRAGVAVAVQFVAPSRPARPCCSPRRLKDVPRDRLRSAPAAPPRWRNTTGTERVHSSAGAPSPTPTAAPAGPDAPARPRRTTAPRCGAADTPARRRRTAGVDELPLVISCAALVHADGLLGALALYAENPRPARPHSDAARLRTDLRGTTDRGAPGTSAPSRGGSTQPTATRRLGARGAGEYRLELAVGGHRIFVLLAEELLLHQHVDVGRAGAGAHASFPQADGADVLLAAENQLRLFLALGLVTPRRKGGAHQDGHHGQAHQQSRHGISTLPVLTP